MSIIWKSLAILTVCFTMTFVGCGASNETSQAAPAPELEAEANAMDAAPSEPVEK